LDVNQCVSTCPSNMYANAVKFLCELCSNTCLTCSGHSSNCLTCNAGLVLLNGSCIDSCGSGKFNFNNSCTGCASSCFQCTNSAGNCTAC